MWWCVIWCWHRDEQWMISHSFYIWFKAKLWKWGWRPRSESRLGWSLQSQLHTWNTSGVVTVLVQHLAEVHLTLHLDGLFPLSLWRARALAFLALAVPDCCWGQQRLSISIWGDRFWDGDCQLLAGMFPGFSSSRAVVKTYAQHEKKSVSKPCPKGKSHLHP